MKNHKLLVGLLALIVLLVTACAPVDSADQTKSENPAANASGNSYSDPNLYVIRVEISGGAKDHTEIHGSGSSFSYNGYGSGSMVIWQDGKGLIPARVLSIDPSTPIVSAGDYVILKTEDLKASALQAGWIVELKCRMDYEPLTNLGVQDEVVDASLTQTWELDKCRMTTPEFGIAVEPAE